MTTVLITQANGQFGRNVIDHLLANDDRVLITAAVPENCEYTHDDPRVVSTTLDFDTFATLDVALHGIDKVLWHTPITPLASIYTERFLQLAKTAGVGHIVFISMLHASPTGLQDIARQHARSEELIRQSDIPYTVLRPSAFAQQLAGLWPWLYEPQTDTFYSPAPAGKIAWLDMRDAAHAAAHALLHPETQNHAYTITGPAALSLQEAVVCISQVVKRDLNVVCMDKDEYLERMRDFGATEYLIDSFTTLYDAIDADEWATITNEYSTLLHRAPIAFEQFVTDYQSVWGGRAAN